MNVSSKVAPYLNLYPLPNVPSTADIGQYRFSSQNITMENFFTSRVDHHFSDKDQIHGTFLLDNSTLSGPDSFGDTLLGTISQHRTASLEESHILSPTLINFVRIGFNRSISEAVKTLQAINPLVGDPSLGFIPGHAVGQLTDAGLTSFQGGLDPAKSEAPANIHPIFREAMPIMCAGQPAGQTAKSRSILAASDASGIPGPTGIVGRKGCSR